MGIKNSQHFNDLVGQIEDVLKQSRVVKAVPPPGDTPHAMIFTWVQASVHICEYSQAVSKLGQQRVHTAAFYPPSADMVSALVTKSAELRDSGSDIGGMCSMILMIQEWERKMPKHEPHALTPEKAMVLLAKHGLSPKACWWLNGNVFGVWEGVRRMRTRLTNLNMVMTDVWQVSKAKANAEAAAEDAAEAAAEAMPDADGWADDVAVSGADGASSGSSAPPPPSSDGDGPQDTSPGHGGWGGRYAAHPPQANRQLWRRPAMAKEPDRKQRRQELVTCAECGVLYTRVNHARHLDSEVHKVATGQKTPDRSEACVAAMSQNRSSAFMHNSSLRG